MLIALAVACHSNMKAVDMAPSDEWINVRRLPHAHTGDTNLKYNRLIGVVMYSSSFKVTSNAPTKVHTRVKCMTSSLPS